MTRLLTIAIALTIVGCSSMQKLGGHHFSAHAANEMKNLPEHGFLDVDRSQAICSGDNVIKGGYVVKRREPWSGETESEFQNYQKAEEIRARACAKAALWCSTRTDLLCRADDEKCKVENRNMGERSTCRVRVTDGNANTALSPIRGKVDDGGWINCGVGSDDYTSPLAWITSTNKALTRDRTKWTEFCQKYRSADECEVILKANESDSFLIQPDSTRWVVDVLVKEKPEVHREGNQIFSVIELDASPACGLTEKRH